MDVELIDLVRNEMAKRSSLHQEPPLPLAEIVVMILVLNPPLTKHAILEYLFDHVYYYHQLALAFSCQWVSSGQHYNVFSRFRTEFFHVFDLFDVPLIHSNPRAGTSESTLATWTVSSSAVRLFLTSRLFPENEKVDGFPFLRLPPDLRMLVYEFALLLPKSGILMDSSDMLYNRTPRWSFRPELKVFSRGQDSFEQVLGTHPESEPALTPRERGRDLFANFLYRSTLTCGLYGTHLALLVTCKQVYQEAMPVFYGQNNFVCRSLDQLQVFLEATPKARRAHISRITFYYDAYCRRGTHAALRMLKEQERLHTLHVWISEFDWLKVTTTTRPLVRKYKNVSDIPAIQILRSIRGLKEVTFHGDCDTVRYLVGSDMTKEKAFPLTFKAKAKVRRPEVTQLKSTE
ncbi:hypothetical protein CBER1_11639 [Cercospora berteroae]|uniref:DUF7730 domain-containing protein n=1 Tax=Cercospora berteroae TaxID=357750 RepID=A0A2S6CMB8_9PEZI|nr:hypothetical protein CBER1_11639 [Cercospora berteroae]